MQLIDRDTKSTNRGITRRALCVRAGALGVAGALGILGMGGCSSNASEDAASSSSANADASDSSDSSQEMASRVFFVFDTIVTVKGTGITDEMFDQIDEACTRYDNLFSAQNDSSDIGRINSAGGEPVEVDPDTADLISRSLDICELLDGDFDITIGAVSLLWDFQNAVKPDDDVIAEAVTHVDWHNVQVDGTTVTLLDPQAKLDLGGIAKGWIADKLREMLSSWGVTSADIDLGTSSIYVLGTKPDGTLWRLGLRDPASPDGNPLGVIEASDRAVVTSGLYDQHFELDGVDYYHILDPRTGYPAQTDMLALTAVLGDSLLGDGLSTAFFVKGTQGSLDWMSKHPDRDVEAVFIEDDDNPVVTSGLEDRYAFDYRGNGTVTVADPDTSASSDGDQ